MQEALCFRALLSLQPAEEPGMRSKQRACFRIDGKERSPNEVGNWVRVGSTWKVFTFQLMQKRKKGSTMCLLPVFIVITIRLRGFERTHLRDYGHKNPFEERKIPHSS